jgi:hypothetical protein
MIQNQPTASLRTLSALLYDAYGSPLPSGTSWEAGMVKLSKANGAFVNTTNLPTAVADGADNSFVLQLEITEVNTLGPLRIQLFDEPDGNVIAEYVDEVVADLADTLEDAHGGGLWTSAVDSAEIATEVWGAILEETHTASDLVRLLVAIAAGDRVDDEDAGTSVYYGLDGSTERATGTVDDEGRDATVGTLSI